MRYVFIIMLFFANTAFGDAWSWETDKLRWDPVEGAIGYKVYYGQNEDSMSFSQDVGNNTEYQISLLPHIEPNYPWYFSVSAYAFNVESDKCPAIRWSGLSKSHVLSWSSSESFDVILYRVYMQGTEHDWQSTLPIYEGPELSLQTPLLTGGETYYWRVVAVDSAGNESTVKEISETIGGIPAIHEPDLTPPGEVGSIILMDTWGN
jgi:hypothetical protein